MRLVITKVNDRLKTMKVLRELSPFYSIKDALSIVDSINEKPFETQYWLNNDRMNALLNGIVEYTYETMHMPDCYPWEQEEYIQAREWYKNLPDIERRRVDILVNASAPWG